MTRHILDTGGVIGDFHGDAAMGFWGWPLDQSDTAIRAAEAASKILADSSPADDFRCGIGIASGQAVAGRIGTVDQVKVTAFGPVVNLANRLEGLTKAFGAEVIVDEPTARSIGDAANASLRTRRLALVRPAGMGKAVEAHELLMPTRPGDRVLSDLQVAEYEAGLDALIRGDWGEAQRRLRGLPEWDRPKDVLLATILRHNRVPPENWAGVIDLPKP